MKRSQLFTKTLKDAPADEKAKNAQLLIRAGFVHKEMAGVYTFLPLGLRVLEKINNIIRDEMNAIGGIELRMTTLQDPEIWKATDRWDDEKVDVWFKSELKNGTVVGLGPTHEEPLVRALKQHVNSYKDLPFMAYQIQTKFRNETRAKSGVMRGREFLMKDLYTFARTDEEHDELYERVKQSYYQVFNRLGIGGDTYLTFASGGMFSQFSHEFQTVCDAGEDTIYLDDVKKIAVNEEVMQDDILEQLELKRENLKEVKAAEVGNIFTLKDKFSSALNLTFTDDKGKDTPVLMGCYGIGPSRLVGVITELLADDKGLVWPANIAPFHVYLVSIGDGTQEKAEEIYSELSRNGVEVLYDDRDERPGSKFADAELMGIPYRIVISDKTLDSDSVELSSRSSGENELVPISEITQILQQKIQS